MSSDESNDLERAARQRRRRGSGADHDRARPGLPHERVVVKKDAPDVVATEIPGGGDGNFERRFHGDSLARMRLATRLMQDLEINTAGVALALDLLDRIAELESRLRR